MVAIAFAIWTRQRGDLGAETFATGLNQPRGMTFDADGNLLVAEAGAVDDQADERSSPATNHSGRVLRISPAGQVSTVLEGLPFTNYAVAGDVGAADVAVVGDALYVLVGEGYDDELARAVLRVVPGQPPRRVVNLLAYAFATTPLEEQMAAGAVPSNPFAMVAAPNGSAFYITDGASGSVPRATLDGEVAGFARLPGQPPLTGLAFGPDGRLYVAMLSTLPLKEGGGAIWAADAAGNLARAVDNLTMPIDVAFDAGGAMYVLEFSGGPRREQLYPAGSGRLLRVAEDGARTVALDGLHYPTAMIFSGAGDLYITVGGAFSGPGQGAILRVARGALSRARQPRGQGVE